MSYRFIALATLTALTLSTARPAAADVGTRLKNVAAAYADVLGQYPSSYSCELRSPELVASLDANARKAWGSGHIDMTVNPRGLRLEAQDLANSQAAPLFNLALGLWQIKLGSELKILQARLPEFFVAVALGAITRYQGYEQREGSLVRFGLRARGDKEAIREASFLVEKSHAIRELRIDNADGGSIVAKVGNLPAPGGGGRFLVSEIEATITQPGGKVEVFAASLGYAEVEDRLLFEHVVLRVADGEGNLVRRNPKDVNPISYYFSNCRLLPEG
ncbi:MAG: hypothetical protein GY719_20640 [bacterium]|nr:hypothetical protein [bacterium]